MNVPASDRLNDPKKPGRTLVQDSMATTVGSGLRRWIVCESGQRWMTAVRCFATQLTPKPLVAGSLRHAFMRSLMLAVAFAAEESRQDFATLIAKYSGNALCAMV